MKNAALLIFVLIACTAQAHAAKDCEELKTAIAAKIDGKGVKNYTLEIVANDKVGDAKVRGSCENGKKKIIYTKNK